MRSFNDMIKNKRIKVLAFVIFLFALRAVGSADNLEVPSLVQLIKRNSSSDEGFCIAFDDEAYSAIEWSYPIPKNEAELPKTMSSYFPSPIPSYGCNFEENNDCNKIWNLKNWTRPTHTSKNYKPILDSRWEDFRAYLVSSGTKIDEYRTEIPTNSDIGISLRSADSVDILLCEGFNPASYPCYKITLGGATKKNINIESSETKSNVTVYESEYPLMSVDEWKHFQLSLSSDGRIGLMEINKELFGLSDLPLVKHKILYLLVNSTSPALWKIHKNYFLSTNVSQYTEFGPAINVTSSSLCLSMYLMMCKNCSIYFYKTTGIDKEIVFGLDATDNKEVSSEWKHIKITIENLTEDILQLYIKTNSDAVDRFWAIDNVRTCIQDEFKIRRLVKSEFSTNIQIRNPSFSCHSLEFPQWRPKPELLSTEGLPTVSNFPNTTSIQLHWTPSTQPYIINYKGSDICDRTTSSQFKNVQRLKSNGWVVAKPKEKDMLIQHLVPYTHYDVTFIDPLYSVNKSLSMYTKGTDKPNPDEIPTINITTKTRAATINISLRKCSSSYGPILYKVGIVQQSKSQILVDGRVHTWKDLEPHTNYTFCVQIARTITNLDNPALRTTAYYNFTTKPDVAPLLESVELYEISAKSASFRYKLPKKSNGIPVLIQIIGSTPLLKTPNQNISNIIQCDLWKDWYCASINDLLKNANYKFKISIKNNNTNAFGSEFQIGRKTANVAPGTPTNISYSVANCSEETDFCNLNVSWTHPYDHKGVIKGFKIILGEDGVIAEDVQINGKYLPAYWHVIRELPYSKTYNMSIYAYNVDCNGLAATKEVKIDHIGQHIDQMPKIVRTSSNSITIQVPKLDSRLKSSTLLIVVQSSNSEEASISQPLTYVAEELLCLQNRTSWLAGAWKVSHQNVINITIGNDVRMFVDALNGTTVNKALTPNVNYCLNFIFNNTYHDVYHMMVYHQKNVVLNEISEEPQTNVLPAGSIIVLTLLIILLIAVIVFGIVCYKRNKRRRRVRCEGEHIYEAMPDDEPNEVFNVVYNAVYDKLNHD